MVQDNVATKVASEISDLEHSLEITFEEMIEQMRAIYRERRHAIDLREYPRVRFSEQVSICPASALGVPLGSSIMAEGREWSLNGISMLSPQAFEMESYLVVEFMRPGDVNRIVKMLCQVRHAQNESQDHIVGCEFITMLSD
jgi:hypothetical protein